MRPHKQVLGIPPRAFYSYDLNQPYTPAMRAKNEFADAAANT
jgi:hypothetical protein